MKKKIIISENYLERKPMRKDGLSWTKNEENIVTLELPNTGIFNRIAQKLFKKPKVTYIHLDETGSFLWPLLDGSKTILTLGEELEKEFGEKSHPLYERLAKYFQILESYNFIEYNKGEG